MRPFYCHIWWNFDDLRWSWSSTWKGVANLKLQPVSVPFPSLTQELSHSAHSLCRWYRTMRIRILDFATCWHEASKLSHSLRFATSLRTDAEWVSCEESTLDNDGEEKDTERRDRHTNQHWNLRRACDSPRLTLQRRERERERVDSIDWFDQWFTVTCLQPRARWEWIPLARSRRAMN